ncbi:MAG: Abi family protein [Clostridiaceae bacterium]|nr:Abi family protein [Clostridiaceae bacterium]
MPYKTLSYEEFLDFDQQIRVFKRCGISFERKYTEEMARAYLKNNNSFYRLSSYCDSFERRRPDGGDGAAEYEGLDFQHLVDLSIIDFRLREVLLHLIIHIEHHLKIKLSRFLRLYAIDPCAIVKEFAGSQYLPQDLYRTMQRASSSDYSRDIYLECEPDVPVWVMLELLQLGELKAFISFLRYQDIFSEEDSCTLADLDYELGSVRTLRNAAAHNSGILNGLLQCDNRKLSDRIYNELLDAKDQAGNYIFTEEELEDSNLSRALKDITTAVFLHHDLVTSPGVKRSMAERLHELKLRFNKRISYDPDKAAGFSLAFLARVIDLWHPFTPADN